MKNTVKLRPFFLMSVKMLCKYAQTTFVKLPSAKPLRYISGGRTIIGRCLELSVTHLSPNCLLKYLSFLVRLFDIPKTEEDCRWKLREGFYKNACVTDLRVIDMLVIKGFMNLKEITENWQQKGHIMSNWHPTAQPKPCDFVGKFLNGVD